MLIVLEGLPGCGKTTQAELLKKYCYDSFKDVEIHHFPAKDVSCSMCTEDYLRYGSSSNTFLMSKMFMRNIKEKVDRLRDKIEDERWVIIFDRYFHSTYANQGAVIHLQMDESKWNYWFKDIVTEKYQLPVPDFSFFLSTSLDRSRDVAIQRGLKDTDKKMANLVDVFCKYVEMLGDDWFNLECIHCMEGAEMLPPEVIRGQLLKIIGNTPKVKKIDGVKHDELLHE